MTGTPPGKREESAYVAADLEHPTPPYQHVRTPPIPVLGKGRDLARAQPLQLPFGIRVVAISRLEIAGNGRWVTEDAAAPVAAMHRDGCGVHQLPAIGSGRAKVAGQLGGAPDQANVGVTTAYRTPERRAVARNRWRLDDGCAHAGVSVPRAGSREPAVPAVQQRPERLGTDHRQDSRSDPSWVVCTRKMASNFSQGCPSPCGSGHLATTRGFSSSATTPCSGHRCTEEITTVTSADSFGTSFQRPSSPRAGARQISVGLVGNVFVGHWVGDALASVASVRWGVERTEGVAVLSPGNGGHANSGI